MTVRRIAVLAVAGVMALAPTAGRALAESAAEVPGTTCLAGNETLTYDPVTADWTAMSNIACTSTYPQLVLSVSLVQIQALANTVVIGQSGIFCLECGTMQHRINRGKSLLTTGIYQVRTGAMVLVPTNSWHSVEHFSCWFVKDYQATLLLAGCPKGR